MERPRRSYAVWEITLQCNLACTHCGSRAGSKRPDELSTAEALEVVKQLSEVGIEEVTLIGGEAFLRRDWLTIAAAIRDAGMTCTLTTGGYGISAGLARNIFDAGIKQVSVSVDGLEATHDHLRGRPGSWRACLAAMENLAQAGIDLACNTQINRLTAGELTETYGVLQGAGMTAWQVQLTVPMGNAADRPEILMQPVELLELFPLLVRLKSLADRDGVYFAPGNNIGYYGPFEGQLRPQEQAGQVWGGCHAGLNTLGLEADGTIKGCPSLPTAPYTGGNIRDRSLRDIILNTPQLNFNAGASTDHLWGFCQTCTYAKLCRGGCTWTAHVFFDRPGNNPYCHHRALMQAERGIRERLVRTQPPPGVPFDNGVFQLIEEPVDAPWPGDDPHRLELSEAQTTRMHFP